MGIKIKDLSSMPANDPIQYVKEEENDTYSDDSLFQISSWGADLSFRELIARYDDDELEKPELQRNYIWDRHEASRFIDSLLLGLPVPSIFLAKTTEEKLLIIDGFQRLTTVRDFVRGIFSRDGRSFKLSRTNRVNPRWRGRAFVELSDSEQRRIKNTTIHAIIFNQLHPTEDDTSLFQVFERINTSGRTLLAQEIRNCVAQGSFNSMLIRLNMIPQWRELFGAEEPDSRMRDMEFILRFFALSSESFKADERERLSLKRFLDLFMQGERNVGSATIQNYTQRFLDAVALVHEVFGDTAFHNISPSDPRKLVPKFSPTIFDSITIAADYALRGGAQMVIPGNPEAARRALLGNGDYRFAITKETMSRSCIIKRVSMACTHLFGVEYEQQ